MVKIVIVSYNLLYLLGFVFVFAILALYHFRLEIVLYSAILYFVNCLGLRSGMNKRILIDWWPMIAVFYVHHLVFRIYFSIHFIASS